jgi:hypothetical protein
MSKNLISGFIQRHFLKFNTLPRVTVSTYMYIVQYTVCGREGRVVLETIHCTGLLHSVWDQIQIVSSLQDKSLGREEASDK